MPQSPLTDDQDLFINMEKSNGDFGECSTKASTQLEDTEVNSGSFIEDFESKFAIGHLVRNPEDAYLLYCEYGRVKGFSVRRGKQAYFHGSNELYMKEFECSCNGKKDEKCSMKGNKPVYQKMEKRTGCTARLRIGRKKNDEWKVLIFKSEHNHDMARADESYMLKSARAISYAKGDTLKALVDAGFSVANAYSYMQKESYGRENVGFLKKDAYDYLNRLAKSHRRVEDGDAAELIRYFKDKSNEDSMFYWDFQVDENKRLCNFLFRDGRCRIDYETFGDVLSFDTTYKTNKYDMICAPFTGINHHKCNVIFGLAFMSDETEMSFQWLFKTFLESMSGKQPETIFTDQCQAMMNAVEIVFPNSHHRLCQWHIHQNAPSHFGSLNNDSKFKSMFRKCMEFCETEDEFESVWGRMIVDYNLHEHSWLKKMYKLRHKWSTAFSAHRFNDGLKATSRSEATNSSLKYTGKRTDTLFECVLRYERIQNTWRQDEMEDDFRCHHEMPTLAVKTNCLLIEAAKIYTHKIYFLFESQLMGSLGIDFDGGPTCVGSLSEFKVRSQGASSRFRKVQFDMESHEVKYSCHYFESVGILCKHALLVLKQMNVHKIPTRHINVRWTKSVRDRVHSTEDYLCSSAHESETVYVNFMMRFSYDLMMRSKMHPDARDLVRNGLKVVLSDLNGLLDRLSTLDIEESNVVVDEQVHNPLHVKSRGINNVRLPNHWDSKSKGRKRSLGPSKKTTKNSRKNAQGSKIPIDAPISQEATNVLISSQDFSYGHQTVTQQPHWMIHMPYLPMHVGHGQFSPIMSQNRDPNIPQDDFFTGK